jgi:RNA polymerase sigma factor (sigma-70 family)
MENFPETSWSLLGKARGNDDSGLRARCHFAERYYVPVRAFLASVVNDVGRADDLTHEFFIRLMEKGSVLRLPDPQRSFREYLKQFLRNLVRDDYRRIKRAGVQIYPDGTEQGWDALARASLPPAEAAFHASWVRLTLAEALARVRAICPKQNQEMHLQLFEARYLSEAHATPTWTEIGERFGLDQKTARERAGTVAHHFRRALRRILANDVQVTVTGTRHGSQTMDAAVDREIRALLEPLEN